MLNLIILHLVVGISNGLIIAKYSIYQLGLSSNYGEVSGLSDCIQICMSERSKSKYEITAAQRHEGVCYCSEKHVLIKSSEAKVALLFDEHTSYSTYNATIGSTISAKLKFYATSGNKSFTWDWYAIDDVKDINTFSKNVRLNPFFDADPYIDVSTKLSVAATSTGTIFDNHIFGRSFYIKILQNSSNGYFWFVNTINTANSFHVEMKKIIINNDDSYGHCKLYSSRTSDNKAGYTRLTINLRTSGYGTCYISNILITVDVHPKLQLIRFITTSYSLDVTLVASTSNRKVFKIKKLYPETNMRLYLFFEVLKRYKGKLHNIVAKTEMTLQYLESKNGEDIVTLRKYLVLPVLTTKKAFKLKVGLKWLAVKGGSLEVTSKKTSGQVFTNYRGTYAAFDQCISSRNISPGSTPILENCVENYSIFKETNYEENMFQLREKHTNLKINVAKEQVVFGSGDQLKLEKVEDTFTNIGSMTFYHIEVLFENEMHMNDIYTINVQLYGNSFISPLYTLYQWYMELTSIKSRRYFEYRVNYPKDVGDIYKLRLICRSEVNNKIEKVTVKTDADVYPFVFTFGEYCNKNQVDLERYRSREVFKDAGVSIQIVSVPKYRLLFYCSFSSRKKSNICQYIIDDQGEYIIHNLPPTIQEIIGYRLSTNHLYAKSKQGQFLVVPFYKNNTKIYAAKSLDITLVDHGFEIYNRFQPYEVPKNNFTLHTFGVLDKASKKFLVVWPWNKYVCSKIAGTTTARTLPSCWSFKEFCPNADSREYWIHGYFWVPIKVFCDMYNDGGGWTRIIHYALTDGKKTSIFGNFTDSIHHLTNKHLYLSDPVGFKNLFNFFSFSSLRIVCYDDTHQRKVHLRSSRNENGFKFLNYILGLSTKVADSGSYVVLPDDNSNIVSSRSNWGWPIQSYWSKGGLTSSRLYDDLIEVRGKAYLSLFSHSCDNVGHATSNFHIAYWEFFVN